MTEITKKCDTCSKECQDHRTCVLLIDQHNERIDTLEDTYDVISANNNNIEGRLNMFIWAVGLVFMLIVSISFYGLIELNDFKHIYIKDIRKTNVVISELNNNIKITNVNLRNLKDDVNDLKFNSANHNNNDN